LAGLGRDDPLTARRRQKLLADAAGADTTAVEDLAVLVDELDRRRAELDRQRPEAEAALAAMNAEATELQQELSAAQDAQAEVEEQIRQLEAARQEAERQRLAAEEQARQEAAAASVPDPPEPSANVPVQAGDMICPVQGAVSFVDSWGAPRPQGRHMGVDLMAARGTPNVAVVSGEVTMRSPGGLPGLGVHLQGDDGNLYYYFHFDSYEGGSRRVAQGDVVGYTGNTGDASGGPTHTHFEVHPGGGGAVNPYPYVAAVC
jgi:murein DD-endopeptidase MepM/ murein hydrolase activator NlpD